MRMIWNYGYISKQSWNKLEPDSDNRIYLETISQNQVKAKGKLDAFDQSRAIS